MLASALFLAAGAAGSAPVMAADDLVELHAPCHHALSLESSAATLLSGPNANRESALRTLARVTLAEKWNNTACATIASRTAAENASNKQMHDVNAAFLQSLRAQADTVLQSRFEARDYAQAARQLSACATSATLPADVRARCRTQLAYNADTRRQSMPGTTDPCDVALVAANDAGSSLNQLKDYANFEKAYLRATDGLTANKNCTRPQMRDVNSAYLLTWKAVAEKYLDVPYTTADPFAVPNDLLRKCGSSVPPLPLKARTDCTEQLASNLHFLIDQARQPAPFPGQTVQPLPWQAIEWPYALRPDFVWDGPCKNNENAQCADEKVRDGHEPNGWGAVTPGDRTTPVPIEGDRERALFATIRNCDDLHRLFTGQPPQFTCDFFNDTAAHKAGILLVVAQHKPHQQQCGMNIDRVQSITAPSSNNPPRDAVRLNYTLTCAPPAGTVGSTAVKVVSIPGSNANGAFANVTFLQSGGGGPRSATP